MMVMSEGIGLNWQWSVDQVPLSNRRQWTVTDHLCDEDADDPNVDEQFGHTGARPQRT